MGESALSYRFGYAVMRSESLIMSPSKALDNLSIDQDNLSKQYQYRVGLVPV
jgi:hypothetical protein